MKHFPRAVSVPFALHYIEKSALGAVCRALCCCIYVEGEIRFPSPTPFKIHTFAITASSFPPTEFTAACSAGSTSWRSPDRVIAGDL